MLKSELPLVSKLLLVHSTWWFDEHNTEHHLLPLTSYTIQLLFDISVLLHFSRSMGTCTGTLSEESAILLMLNLHLTNKQGYQIPLVIFLILWQYSI